MNLESVTSKKYGANYKEHLFGQYKIMVDSAEKNSDRRNGANNFFLSLNTVIVALIGTSIQINSLSWIRVPLYITGIFFSIIFFLLIRSYKQLNTGKFKVIHEMEKRLPLKMYAYEWYVLGEGKDKKIYYPFSHIEQWIPIVFGIVYSILIIPSIISLFNRFCGF